MPGRSRKPPQDGTTRVSIPAPNLLTITLACRGTAPLVVNAFSNKSEETIAARQEMGSVGKKSKGARAPRDFQSDFEGARHRFADGGDGFCASSIRNACISACRLVQFTMTIAKLSVFCIADGEDVVDGTPLVRIIAPEPELFRKPGRNSDGSVDLRVRPMWRRWGAILRLEYDADQFTGDDVANLVLRVGKQVGIGEGRHDSRKSCGIGLGTFRLLEEGESLADLMQECAFFARMAA